MATEFSESEHHDNPNATNPSPEPRVEFDSVPLLPPGHGDGPQEPAKNRIHRLEEKRPVGGPPVPLIPADEHLTAPSGLSAPDDYGHPAPGLEFAPPAPEFADAFGHPEPGHVADVSVPAEPPVEPPLEPPVESQPKVEAFETLDTAPPIPPTPGANLEVQTPSLGSEQPEPNTLPAWALADPSPAGSSEAAQAERAAWPTVHPEPLESGAAIPGEPPAAPEDQPTELHVEPPAAVPAQAAPGMTPPAYDATPAKTESTPPLDVAPPQADHQQPEHAVPAEHEPAPMHAAESTGQEQPVAAQDTPHVEEPQGAPGEEASAGGPEMYDVPLGTLVYRSGLLSAEQIESALAESERIGKRLGEVLVDTEMIDERDLGRLLAGQKGLPFIDLANTHVEPAATELLLAASARIYCALPIAIDKGTPVVAVGDPTNGLVVEGVRRAMGGEIAFTVATRSELQSAIANHYGGDASAPIPEPAATAVPAPAVPNPDPPLYADAPPIDDGGVTPIAPVVPAASDSTDPATSESNVAPVPAAPTVETASEPVPAPTTVSEEPVPMIEPDFAPAVHDVQADLPQQQPPTPLVAHPTGDAAVAAGKTIHVKVRLSDGDLIDAGAFADSETAMAHARTLIQSISVGDSGDWPFLAGRFVRPGMVVSIDLAEEITRY